MIKTELEKIKSISSTAELYLIFFRLLQIFVVLGFAYNLCLFSPLFLMNFRQSEISSMFNPLYFLTPLIIGALQIFLSELCLRAVERKKFWGVALGLIMSVLMLPSFYFVLGAFGLYCFLNPNFQKEYLQESPKAFKEALTNFGLNKMTSNTHQSA